jgi:hypothetical protein
MRIAREQLGQATVELVAILPAVVLACAIAWELALAGDTAWLAAHAARAGARAAAVGADPQVAARSVLSGASVTSIGGGRVRVRARVPLLVPGWNSAVRVSATAGLGAGS